MSTNWRGPINQLLYGLMYSSEITDELVDFFASSAAHRTTPGLGPEVYYGAIHSALTSGEILADPQLPQFDSAAIAGFLNAVATRLDALRPWPEPRFRWLGPAAFERFEHAATIGWLDASVLDVAGLLQLRFDPAGAAEPGKYVSTVMLQTGETVALIGSYAPGDKIALLTASFEGAAQTLEHFVAVTGFPADKVVSI